MGTVYLAWDKNLQTKVVVKAPHPSLLHDSEYAKRFLLEVQSLVDLAHPHIVSIREVGQHEGIPYAVIQYLGGGNLETRHTQNNGSIQPVSPHSLFEWLPAIANALDFIHSKGFVHRDVKPANIQFDGDDNAYLSDFGIAKAVSKAESQPRITSTGMIIGTPEYIAPEIILGQSYDGRSDQYSLALAVFELLTGQTPFSGKTPSAVMVEATTKKPMSASSVNSNIPKALSDVLDKALSKEPSNRFSSCKVFAEKIEQCVGKYLSERSVNCPSCKRKLKLKPKVAGKKLPCPACKTTLSISDYLTIIDTSKSSAPMGKGQTQPM